MAPRIRAPTAAAGDGSTERDTTRARGSASPWRANRARSARTGRCISHGRSTRSRRDRTRASAWPFRRLASVARGVTSACPPPASSRACFAGQISYLSSSVAISSLVSIVRTIRLVLPPYRAHDMVMPKTIPASPILDSMARSTTSRMKPGGDLYVAPRAGKNLRWFDLHMAVHAGRSEGEWCDGVNCGCRIVR